MKLLFLYLILVNALGYILMLIDKYKAKRNLWRIPESVLMTPPILGGCIGALIGMYSVRHKTKHVKFTIGIPCILAVQIITFLLIYNNTVGF